MLPRYPGGKKHQKVVSQKSLNIPDFHVLLALIYPQEDRQVAPIIAGGLSFEYPSTPIVEIIPLTSEILL